MVKPVKHETFDYPKLQATLGRVWHITGGSSDDDASMCSLGRPGFMSRLSVDNHAPKHDETAHS